MILKPVTHMGFPAECIRSLWIRICPDPCGQPMKMYLPMVNIPAIKTLMSWGWWILGFTMVYHITGWHWLFMYWLEDESCLLIDWSKGNHKPFWCIIPPRWPQHWQHLVQENSSQVMNRKICMYYFFMYIFKHLYMYICALYIYNLYTCVCVL